MASAKAVRSGGFEADFVEPLDKDYECPVCLLALRDPLQTSCGHLICKSCADQLMQHGKLQCPVDKQVSERKELLPDVFHKRKVLSLTVRCYHHAQGCEWTGELRHLQGHAELSGDCKFSLVECAFSVVGCSKKLTSDNCDNHEEQDVTKHMKLLLKSFDTIQQQNTDLESRVAAMDTTIKTLQAENMMLKRGIEPGALPEAVQGRERQFKIYWVIDDWQQTWETAQSENEYNILSRPYYMEEPGYKVCLQVYPNGFGDGRGTHVSVFLKLMKGRYDDNLTWPFSRMFAIGIIDQRPGGCNKLHSLDPPIASEGSADAFRRPTTNMNRGWGWRTFISLADLRTRAYIHNNSIKIMLEVYLG